MAHVAGLATALAALWVLLSGHYTPLLLGLGAASVALVCWLSRRMDIVDHEGAPVHLGFRAPRYWLWLAGQIVASSWDVTRRIWSRDLGLRPALRSTPSPGLTRLGQVIYANSITLTPGTLTVDLEDGRIEVHTIDSRLLDELDRGGMLERVRRLRAR